MSWTRPRLVTSQPPEDDVIAEMEATLAITRIVAPFPSSVIDRIFRHIEGARDENDKLRARAIED